MHCLNINGHVKVKLIVVAMISLYLFNELVRFELVGYFLAHLSRIHLLPFQLLQLL